MLVITDEIRRHWCYYMIVEAPKKLHISDIRKLFLIYTCFDIVTMSSSVESEKKPLQILNIKT